MPRGFSMYASKDFYLLNLIIEVRAYLLFFGSGISSR